MNYYESEQFYESQCASEALMQIRKSNIFRSTVLITDITFLATIFSTVMAVRLMRRKQTFGRTTRNLFFFCMTYYFVHGIYFSYVMNWSMVRLFSNHDEPCNIMFAGSECYFLYLFGIFLRILLVYSQCAVTVERVVIVLLPNSDLINSATLNILTILTAVITSSILKPTAPSELSSTNCFQQIYPGSSTIQNLLSILVVCECVCLFVNILVVMNYKLKSKHMKNEPYNLKSRFTTNNNLYSSMMVSIISIVQAFIYTIYSINLKFAIPLYSNKPDYLNVNIALLLYTIPYAGLALPISILLSINGLQLKRKNKIEQLTTQNVTQDIYFEDLLNNWKVLKPARITQRVN